LNRSVDVTLSAEQFSYPPHRQLFETIARVRASHGIITPQLVIAAMGRDAGKIFVEDITAGQYVKWLEGEAILPPNVLGHRELVPASLWVEHCFTYSNGDICVGVRPPNHHGPWSFTWATKSAFYLWQPDCVRVWPALALQTVAAHDVNTSEPLRRKPGRKPKKDWKLFVAAKLWEMRKAGQRVPPAADFAQLCENELGYQADISHLQKWLRLHID